MVTTLKMDRSELKDLSATDVDGDILTLDDWDVSEVVNISGYTAHMRAEESENFHKINVDANLFEDFKISPTYTQV